MVWEVRKRLGGRLKKTGASGWEDEREELLMAELGCGRGLSWLWVGRNAQKAEDCGLGSSLSELGWVAPGQ